MGVVRARVTYALAELVHLAEDRLNRPLLPRLPGRDEEGEWDPWRAGHASSTAPARTLFVVTTYRRPAAYARLIAQIAGSLDDTPDIGVPRVLVLDDASPRADYAAAHDETLARLGDRALVLRASRNLGKAGYWRTVQRAFDECRTIRPERMIFVQDDLELVPGAIRDALAIWNEIPDARKSVLNLFTAADDELEGRWVHFPRREPAGARFRETAWFDLAAFLVGPRFWEITGHRVFPIHPSRWRARPDISTGVGRQLTRRLWRRGSIYQVHSTLAYHGAERSQMNLEARAGRPMDNRPL